MSTDSSLRTDRSVATLAAALPLVFGTDARALDAAITALHETADPAHARALLRLALLQPARSTRWYQTFSNTWDRLGCPALRPNPVAQRLVLLSDATLDSAAPLIRAFAAARGVHATVDVADFDTVELELLNPNSATYAAAPDVIVPAFSARWLTRQLGGGAVVERAAMEACADRLIRLIETAVASSDATILVPMFAPGAHALPGGVVCSPNHLGSTIARHRLNARLIERQDDRVVVLDQETALHGAGGAHAYAPHLDARARMPFAPSGLIEFAREVAATIAGLAGRSHRALVLDFDDTLWGGVIGDVGAHGIRTGLSTPDGVGYHDLQTYVRGLSSLGVLLAGASRNDPEIVSVFDTHPEIVLRTDDFSALAVHRGRKSASIDQISGALGFGGESMLFVDDSLFELAEVLEHHPSIDVVHAADDPHETLAALSGGRYFHVPRLTDADHQRKAQIDARQRGAALRATSDDYDSYLASLDMHLTVEPLTDANRARVVQLLQKTNQFNLTTRRHQDAALSAFAAAGAEIGVFSYADTFGGQGIIAVVILVPERDAVRIDSWVMSCRVLNRTVEYAIAEWIVERAGTRPIIGAYHPTERNAPVRDLLPRLGFDALEPCDSGEQRWRRAPDAGALPPHHLALTDPSTPISSGVQR